MHILYTVLEILLLLYLLALCAIYLYFKKALILCILDFFFVLFLEILFISCCSFLWISVPDSLRPHLFVFFWRYSQFSEMLLWIHRQSFSYSHLVFSFLCLKFSMYSKANFIQSPPLSTGDVRGLPWPCLLLYMKRLGSLLRSVGDCTVPSSTPYFRSLSPNTLFLLYSGIFQGSWYLVISEKV